MFKLFKSSTLIFLGVLLFYLPGAFAAAPKIESVKASVIALKNPPELVKERMEKTVAVIGEQLFLGKFTSAVTSDKAKYEKIIHEVFDKVLVGYSVKSVSLSPQEEAYIEIELLPWEETINEIKTELEVEGMPPVVEEIIRRDLVDLPDVFKRALFDLPVAAADWTNGVLKRSLNEYMEKKLPEFRADFDLEPGAVASVKVTVYPRLPVVRSVDLNMRSDSIPNFTLLYHREEMQDTVDTLVGVPVGFVARHEEVFAEKFATGLDSKPEFRALKMKTKISFVTKEKMSVMSRSDTERYRIRIEGWADVHRRETNSNRRTMFRLHVGQNLTHNDELFVRADFYPQDVRYDWALGYNRKLLKDTVLNTAYDMRHKRGLIGFTRQLFPKWQLRYEYRWADRNGEAAIRYKLHDFLSLELIRDKREGWLRVIGNF